MWQASQHNFLHTLAGRLLLHLLFWLAAAAFLLYFFGHFTADYRYTFLFVCLLLPVAVGTTYLINYFLIPRYLLRKRYRRFIAYLLFTIILSVWAEMLVMVGALIQLADYRYGNMAPLTTNIFYLVTSLYFLVFLSTSINLLRHWYRSQQHLSELRQQQLEATLKLREAELQLLKGQIHPHFLFNTLNNLYGLALEKSDQMPDAILRLSGLLEALLYRSHQQEVPLKSELKLIEDYVSLEKLRFEGRLEVDIKMEGPLEDYLIAPFLLFPFLENAFKHGFSGSTDGLHLKVEALMRGGTLHFKVTNSVGPTRNPSAMAGGIGLKNVRKRLALLYPRRYQLRTCGISAGSYGAELQLSLNTDPKVAYALP
ncbi:sensor histidine kinase [Nafulsella turpanensis]|uniref:sensor histidine kinase n=1 Tax=Nafulsella turpanensis TaxID=1265690 RepID=UPI000346FFBF|nr:histidine kinase [Nafulsella turpanensis]